MDDAYVRINLFVLSGRFFESFGYGALLSAAWRMPYLFLEMSNMTHPAAEVISRTSHNAAFDPSPVAGAELPAAFAALMFFVLPGFTVLS